MNVGIYVLGMMLCAIFGIGLLLYISALTEQNTKIRSRFPIMAFACVFIICSGIIILKHNCNQDIDLNTIEYDKIITVKNNDGTLQQVVIGDNYTNFVSNLFGDNVFPEDTLVMTYSYNPVKGWVDWGNEDQKHRKLLLPSDPGHEEAMKHIR
jgi:hypothetical protein